MTTTDVNFAEHEANLKAILSDLFNVVHTTNEWTTWNVEDQLALASLVKFGSRLFERVLRPKFDAAVHEGHDNGTISAEVKSVRKRGEYGEVRPGRKAPTADDIMARAMAD